jgi:hypothetical protein
VLVSARKHLAQIPGLQPSMGGTYDLHQSFIARSRMRSLPKSGWTTKFNGLLLVVFSFCFVCCQKLQPQLLLFPFLLTITRCLLPL